MEKNFKVNSKLLPEGFPREYDAHIYFTEDKLEAATKLRDKFKLQFARDSFFVGDMIPVPIGPHTKPMFEANFPKHMFMEVSLWLMDNRGEFSVLLHSLSGDDLIDHTTGARWLGPEVKLDYSKF
ncbi:MAG: DOPA 4,5-dioxygenase family protein [Rhizobacter sp.]|nr:DOPA 4,5-dioxygenase family protein [Bacteriovorax sp.]